MHCDWAMQHQPVTGKFVLVVGCNSGLDCKNFIDGGAEAVHGLDIDSAIGTDYSHPKVKYFRESAEQMPFDDEVYDLVFCFATMEHVPNIHSAFNEMARVTKKGGTIYSVASPLWNSRNGHHFPQYFFDLPWAHLRLDCAGIEQYLNDKKVNIAPVNVDASTVARYIYDRQAFNRTPPTEYVMACAGLSGFHILRNGLDLEPEDSLPADVLTELESKGFSSEELRAVTHTFIGKKRKPNWTDGIFSLLMILKQVKSR